MRVELVNTDTSTVVRFLEVVNIVVDHLRLYSPGPAGYSVQEITPHTPFDQRSVSYRIPTFAVTLPPGQPTVLYLRVDSRAELWLPMRLWNLQGLHAKMRSDYLILGLFCGALTLLVVFAIAVYWGFG